MRALRWFHQSPDGCLWNVTLNAGVGGATAATDQIGGVDHQLVKVEYGAGGSATQVSPANPLPTRQNGGTTTTANVASAAVTGTVLAANAARLRAWLYNDSTSNVYVKFGAAASSGSFTKLLLPNEFFVVEGYTGIIDAIWAVANGNMRVTELTP